MNITQVEFNCPFCGCTDLSEISFRCNYQCKGQTKKQTPAPSLKKEIVDNTQKQIKQNRHVG